MAGYLATNQRDQAHVRAASVLALDGRYNLALHEARKVRRAPARAHALRIRAYVAQAIGRHGEAVRLFQRAAGRNPRSWSIHRDWAISLLALGDRHAARRQLDRASTLNPRMQVPPGF